MANAAAGLKAIIYTIIGGISLGLFMGFLGWVVNMDRDHQLLMDSRLKCEDVLFSHMFIDATDLEHLEDEISELDIRVRNLEIKGSNK